MIARQSSSLELSPYTNEMMASEKSRFPDQEKAAWQVNGSFISPGRLESKRAGDEGSTESNYE